MEEAGEEVDIALHTMKTIKNHRINNRWINHMVAASAEEVIEEEVIEEEMVVDSLKDVGMDVAEDSIEGEDEDFVGAGGEEI